MMVKSKREKGRRNPRGEVWDGVAVGKVETGGRKMKGNLRGVVQVSKRGRVGRWWGSPNP